MKVGVLGLGYWGPNIVRNFMNHPDVDVVVGCDAKQDRLNNIKAKFPSVLICNDYYHMLRMDLDIIAIVTPVDTHYSFSKAALESGKHIWVEKPFTASSQQAIDLIKLAEEKNLKIFVDHTFLYTGAVRKIKELIMKGELGDIIYFDSVRINLGLFQNDVNVIWDLAPHDLSIMNYLLADKTIKAVDADGIANYYNLENLAHISIYFKDNCFAHFNVNWTSPVKIRKMIVGGTKKMLVYDDMENFEKIKVYDSGITMRSKENIHEALAQYRIGDMYSPRITQTEALAAAVDEFILAIKEDRQPLTDGKNGLDVVKILEATDESIKASGKLIELNQEVMV